MDYEAFVRDLDKTLSGREVVLTLRDLRPGSKRYRGLGGHRGERHRSPPDQAKSSRVSSIGVPCGVRSAARSHASR